MTLFNSGPNATTIDFTPGDVGYVKRNFGHYIENTGDTDLQFIEVFRTAHYEEVSLSDWLTHTPPALVAQHLKVAPEVIAKWPRRAPGIMPA
jgi:oxalate decarboxylase